MGNLVIAKFLEIWNILWRVFLSVFSLALLSVGFYSIPANAEEILNYKIDNYKEINPKTQTITDKGDMVTYQYISTEIAPPEQISYNQQKINEIIEQRTPSATFFDYNGQKIIKLYTDNTFYKKNNAWYNIETKITTPSDFEKLNKKFILTAAVSFWGNLIPTAYAATTTYSGYGECDISYNNASFYTTRTNGSGTVGGAGTISAALAYRWAAGNFYVNRYFLKFNTSYLSTTAVIGTSSIFIYNDSANTYTGTSSVGIFNSNAADTLATTDYQNGGTTQYSNTTWTYDATTGAYREFPLNTTGTNYIKSQVYLTQTTKFVARNYENDVGSSTPPNNHTNGGAYFFNSTYAGTDRDPYLLINYTDTGTTTVYTTCTCSSSMTPEQIKIIIGLMLVGIFCLVFDFFRRLFAKPK